jgi:hypothetical protein
LDGDRFFVKTLTLENFRCFEKAELGPFNPHFNLLVGMNGAGKSSVLLALANLFRQVANRPVGIAMKPLIGDADVRIDYHGHLDGIYPHGTRPQWRISASFSALGAPLFFTESSDDRPTLPSGQYGGPEPQSAANEPNDLPLLSAGTAYPLILRFGTSRPFEWRSDIGEYEAGFLAGDRWTAFRGWTNSGASSDALRIWMRDQTLIDLQTDRAGRSEGHEDANNLGFNQLKLVQQACRDAVEGATGIEYVGTRKSIVVSFADGRTLDFSSMSDGQRALVGMVADISRRACQLNASYLGAQTLSLTPGLILIDELDLHLHPRWQRRIVGDLKHIFPNIQFFATTHSPQVIGEARPEEIVQLTSTGQRRPMQSFGMDSNWVLECVMEAEGRDPGIALRIKALFDAIEEGRFEDARGEISKLRKDIGEAPDIVGAESYLWNLEHSGDEAAE